MLCVCVCVRARVHSIFRQLDDIVICCLPRYSGSKPLPVLVWWGSVRSKYANFLLLNVRTANWNHLKFNRYTQSRRISVSQRFPRIRNKNELAMKLVFGRGGEGKAHHENEYEIKSQFGSTHFSIENSLWWCTFGTVINPRMYQWFCGWHFCYVRWLAMSLRLMQTQCHIEHSIEIDPDVFYALSNLIMVRMDTIFVKYSCIVGEKYERKKIIYICRIIMIIGNY